MRHLAAIILGMGSGMVVSGAVFAFIAAIGVVTTMASRTGTVRYVRFYEEAIIIGGIFGVVAMVFSLTLPTNAWIVGTISILGGIFFGALAMSLAETLDVLPILSRRLKLKSGLNWMVCAIGIGKVCGALLYFLVDGFFIPD